MKPESAQPAENTAHAFTTPRRQNAKGQNGNALTFGPLRLCVLAFFLLPFRVLSATNDLTSALQKGLFEEEANHNLEAAAQAYRDLSAQFDKDRKVAATAVFRLGEIYRKQGKTNEAVVQYERIVREFSDQETLATLSRQNLASLGRSFQPSATAALSPAARLEQRRLLEAEIKLLETKAKSEKLLLESGRADLVSTIATQRELLALKRQLVALSLAAAPEDIRAEQGRLLDEEIGLVEQKLERVKATAADREEPSVVSDTERELLALKRQRVALTSETSLASGDVSLQALKAELTLLKAQLEQARKETNAWFVARLFSIPADEFNMFGGDKIRSLLAYQELRVRTLESAIATARGAESELEWNAARLRNEIRTTEQELERFEKTKKDDPKRLPSFLATKDDELKNLLLLRSEKERRLAALKQYYTAEHPEVKTSQAEFDSTAKAVSDRVEGFLIGYRARLGALRYSLAQLEKQPDKP